jgi:hypothetical protein
MPKLISEDDFDRLYHPILAPDGEELIWAHKATLAHPLNHVWTLVDNDENDRIEALPGYHAGNACGYVVTKYPWEDQEIDAIYAEGPNGE